MDSPATESLTSHIDGRLGCPVRSSCRLLPSASPSRKKYDAVHLPGDGDPGGDPRTTTIVCNPSWPPGSARAAMDTGVPRGLSAFLHHRHHRASPSRRAGTKAGNKGFRKPRAVAIEMARFCSNTMPKARVVMRRACPRKAHCSSSISSMFARVLGHSRSKRALGYRHPRLLGELRAGEPGRPRVSPSALGARP